MKTRTTILSQLKFDGMLYQLMVVNRVVEIDCSERCWYNTQIRHSVFEVDLCYDYYNVTHGTNIVTIGNRVVDSITRLARYALT